MKRFLIIVISVLLLAGCKEPLFSELTEQEANEIVGALVDKGIEAKKVKGLEKYWMVMIEYNEFARAVAVLRQSNFPRQPLSGLGEVFKKEGLVSSPVEERARLIHALSQEISGTLSRVDGVLLARVHVAISPPDQITGKQPPSSVSVFIKHRADMDLQRFTPQIKTMVLNGIEGATYDNISVAFFPADPRFEERSMGDLPKERSWIDGEMIDKALLPLAAAFLLIGLAIGIHRGRWMNSKISLSGLFRRGASKDAPGDTGMTNTGETT